MDKIIDFLCTQLHLDNIQINERMNDIPMDTLQQFVDSIDIVKNRHVVDE